MERDLSEYLQKNEDLSAVNADLNGTDEELWARYTNLVRKEQEIRESEERFRGIFNSSLVGIAITDPKGRWLYINEQLCTMLGYSASELQTKTWCDLTPPEDLRQEIGIFQSVLAGKDPENIEKQYLRKDLSRIDVIVSTGVVRNPDGAIAYFSSVILDITARKKIEADLIHQNEELRAAYEQLAGAEEEIRHQYDHLTEIEENHRKTIELLENLVAMANVPIIVWDSEFRVVRMNRIMEQITGRPASSCIGSPFQSLFSPDLVGRVTRLLETTQSGVKWESVELPVLHLDGSYRIILWNTSTLFDSDGITPVATLAQGKDVTDERRYAAEKDVALVEIQKNIAQLAILNDEIRNPLTIMVTCADLLGTKELVDQIQVQAIRIDEMVANLDKRWAESEKVLDIIRRYYQIEVDTNRNSGSKDGIDWSTYAAGIGEISGEGSVLPSLMQEVQAQLYTILDSIDALVYVADMQTYDLLYMNQQGRAFLGNVSGKKCYQVLFSGRDMPCPFCTNNYLMKDFRPTGVYRWECEDTGNGRWFDCRDRAIRWSDGRWVRLEIATDITELRRAEEALRESEFRFRSYIDNAPDGVFLADEKGDYSFVNDAACRITGYPCEELLQKNLLDLIFPDDIPLASAHFKNLVEKRRSSGELRFVTRDGEIRWWIVKAVRLSPVQFLGFSSDITDRKHTELALLESELRYRMLIDKANEGILIAQDGTFVLVNQRLCDILGVSEKELVGRSFLDFIYSDDREMVMSNYLKRIAGETVLEGYEFRIIGEGGRLRWVFLSSALIQWNGRNATLNLVTDITRRKEAEEALYASNQKLRLLTSLTRHDVINKLSVIHLLHDLAIAESDSDKREECLRQASETTQEVEAIIDFTREYEDFGVVSSRWQPVQSVVLNVSSEIGHHGILIETTIPPDIEISADPIIRKVFSTLIENAIRHGRDLTRIIFSCHQEDRQFVIVCEDDGCGISTGDKERIFDHGYGKNTGLGLFLSREILAITGLSIRETGEPGKGATFEILVPEGRWRTV